MKYDYDTFLNKLVEVIMKAAVDGEKMKPIIYIGKVIGVYDDVIELNCNLNDDGEIERAIISKDCIASIEKCWYGSVVNKKLKK